MGRPLVDDQPGLRYVMRSGGISVNDERADFLLRPFAGDGRHRQSSHQRARFNEYDWLDVTAILVC
jgi:hypothetical protein